MAANTKNNVRKTVAEAFINVIKEKPLTWHCGFKKLDAPVNGIYGSKYGRYNRFYLMLVMIDQGYKDNRWYPQSYIFGSPENRAKDWEDPTKIKVLKGEKPVYIDTSFFVPTKEGKECGYKVLTPGQYFQLSDEDKEYYIKYPARKSVPVYNGEQLTGIEPYKQRDDLILTRLDIRRKIDRTLKNMELTVKEDPLVFIPAYNRLGDYIKMPEFESYDNEYEYFSTLLHEMAHATGHETRLNRAVIYDSSSDEYAIEELRAEIASCFSASEFGFELTATSMENHKAYIQSWIEMLENDESILINAIGDAEKIADYIGIKSIELDKERQIELIEKMQRRFYDIVEYYPEYTICLESSDYNLLVSSLIDYAEKYNLGAYELEFVDNCGFTQEEFYLTAINEDIDIDFLEDIKDQPLFEEFAYKDNESISDSRKEFCIKENLQV